MLTAVLTSRQNVSLAPVGTALSLVDGDALVDEVALVDGDSLVDEVAVLVEVALALLDCEVVEVVDVSLPELVAEVFLSGAEHPATRSRLAATEITHFAFASMA